MQSPRLKILYLMEALWELTDEKHPMSAPKLAAELGRRGISAKRRGLYGDIAALNQREERVVSTTRGYYAKKRLFSEEEASVLLWAVETAPFIDEHMGRRLIDALLSTQSLHVRRKLEARSRVLRSPGGEERALDAMRSLHTAIEQRKQITLRLPPSSANARVRLNPYALAMSGGRCLLICNIDGEEGLATVPIDEMEGIRIEKQAWRHYSLTTPYKRESELSNYVSDMLTPF